MIFFSLLIALALEHWHPLKPPLAHYRAFARLAAVLRDKLDGGETSHGLLAWCTAVLPLVLAAWLVQWWLSGWWSPLAWVWSVLVLYFTTGFKYYTLLADDIAAELRADRIQQAQDKLVVWRGVAPTLPNAQNATDITPTSIAALTIERLFGHSLRQTFGVLFWFALLGPAGAVLYRLSSILSRRLSESSPGFQDAPGRIFHALNWLPARLTALTYAVAGNFEDAMLCWRTQSTSWPDLEEGVVLSAGAGAMGVKLGQGEEIGMGDAADAEQIDSAVSMIWRGLMVWLIVGLLLAVAGWAG